MKQLQGKNFLLSLLCSYSVIGFADEKINNNVIPDQQSGYGISIAGLYVQPNADNLGYAVYTTPLPLPAPNWYQKTVKPDYKGAFTVGLQYNLENAMSQARLDWMHFSQNYAANFSATQPNTSVGPSYYFGPAEQFLLNTSASSAVKFKIDNINLLLGHFINLTGNMQIRPFMGVSAAFLKEDIANNYSGSDPVFGPYTHGVNSNSEFKGIGPHLGLDGSYYINNHFGVTAGVASSLLVGRVTSNTGFSSWTSYVSNVALTNTTTANTTLSNQHQTTVVPEIDGKLELFYTTKLDQGFTINAQLGYMFQDYINSINQVLPSSLVPLAWEAGTVAIISQAYHRSDLSMNGPYIRLVVKQ